MMKETNGGAVSWKQVTTLIAAIGGIAGLHVVIGMPMILNHVAPEIDKSIRDYHGWHIQHVHPGAVTESSLEKSLKPIYIKLESIDNHIVELRKR